MKINIIKNLKDYKGLHSSVFATYIICLSPILTMILGLFSLLVMGTYMPMGAMTRQPYIFAFIFPILFLSIDLYSIIIKERSFTNFKTLLKDHAELFILLGFIVWNVLATLLQRAIFGHSLAYTTYLEPAGVQEGLFAFFCSELS